MIKDLIKIDDMHLNSVQPNDIHGYVKAEFGSANGHITTLKVKLPTSAQVYATLKHIQKEEVEVYIVRKGMNMANLGMAIIKSSFDSGFTGPDKYESLADEVRALIGTRILTKDEPEAVFVHHLGVDDVTVMRVDGVDVCACKDVHAYTRPDGVVLFEAKRLHPAGVTSADGMVEAVDYLTTDYFKRLAFGKRAYNSRYVRPASEEQRVEYLKLKYEHYKKLANETDNIK